MARCGCPDPDAVQTGCNCAILAGPSGQIEIAGTGQPTDPYLIDTASDLSGGFIEQRLYTTVGNDTFAKGDYPAAKWVRVTVVGGGGGGAGTQANTATSSIIRAGGAGGNMAQTWVPVAALGFTEPVTVGDGGDGGDPVSGVAAGFPGGDSAFGTHAVAGGGLGGLAAGTPTTGARILNGPNPSGIGVGSIVVWGQPGGPGNQYASGVGQGGKGGDAGGGFGQGNYGGICTSLGGGDSGRDGQNYGAGGSGSASSSAVNRPGGNGRPGLVIVDIWG